jgi:hypothetical protein
MDDQRTDREGGRIRFRKLRIAWSVGWGVIAVLLIALWVRSYSRADILFLRNSSGQRTLGTTTGVFEIASASQQFVNPTYPGDTNGWKYDSQMPTQFGQSTLFYFHLVNQRSPGLFLVLFPGWLPATIFLLLAVAPHLPRWRFSLRTLLIATTRIAVMLGLAVWAVKR